MCDNALLGTYFGLLGGISVLLGTYFRIARDIFWLCSEHISVLLGIYFGIARGVSALLGGHFLGMLLPVTRIFGICWSILIGRSLICWILEKKGKKKDTHARWAIQKFRKSLRKSRYLTFPSPCQIKKLQTLDVKRDLTLFSHQMISWGQNG